MNDLKRTDLVVMGGCDARGAEKKRENDRGEEFHRIFPDRLATGRNAAARRAHESDIGGKIRPAARVKTLGAHWAIR
jgi:hypothetical protein